MSYRETVIQFGRSQGLYGILTEPTEGASNDLCIIMLNAGLLHRVGPFRMHVTLARRLADGGVASFRLDLSGLGDSSARRAGNSVQQNAIEDVRDAMVALRERSNCHKFVIMGLCSGAENAHYVGVELPDVAGLILIDGILHRTRRYYWSHYLPRIFSLSKWTDWLARRAMMYSKQSREAAKLLSAASDIWNVPIPPVETVTRELQQIVDQDTQLLAIFTGGLGYCSYEGQMREAYRGVDFKGKLRARLIRAADHTFSVATHRKILYSEIEKWLHDTPFGGLTPENHAQLDQSANHV